MSIKTVVQKDGNLYVYDEQNGFLFKQPGKLVSQTPQEIRVQNGVQVLRFDSRGHLLRTNP